MTERRGRGRPMSPLSPHLPPARRGFAAELRRLFGESEWTMRELAAAAKMSPSSLSRVLNGERLVSETDLSTLARILEVPDDDAQDLKLRLLQAQAEESLAGGRRQEADPHALRDRLAALYRASGLSLRDIAVHLQLAETPLSRSTVERVLRVPERALPHALQVASILVDRLPESERGAAAQEVLNAALSAASTTPVASLAPDATTQETVQKVLRGVARNTLATSTDIARWPSLPETTLRSLAEALATLPAPDAAPQPVTEADRSQDPVKPISQWNPFDLEVHPAILRSARSTAVQPDLPSYVLREHDRTLADLISDVAEGTSRMAVLVGSSSTGKTRACWEAIQPLAQQGWRLWHPVTPTRAEAVLHGLKRVQPRTVVWLNEAQTYLGQPRLGEHLAAALHELLTRPHQSPVLVLGTLWPDAAAQFTASPSPGAPDPHPQTRELLAGRLIHVPDAFDEEALKSARALAQHGDTRLAEALVWNHHGRVTQWLAAGPALVTRYANATPGARAILNAAIDARRLGTGEDLPISFLIKAAAGYLSDSEFDQLPDDWAISALAEATQAVSKELVPLGAVRAPREAGLSQAAETDWAYRIADYLVQIGRTDRRTQFPPASFWHAAYEHLTASDLVALSTAAFKSARLQWANYLIRHAAELGGGAIGGSATLYAQAAMRERAGDREGAEPLYRQAADARDPLALFHLARMYEQTGDADEIERLAQKVADADGFLPLTAAHEQEEAGEREAAAVLYREAAEAGHPLALFRLIQMYEQAGDVVGAEFFARKAADAGYAWLFDHSARWPNGLDPEGTPL